MPEGEQPIPPPSPRAAFWAEYRRTRRRYWMSYLWITPSLAVTVLLVALKPGKNNPLALALGCPSALWFLACWMSIMATWFKLLSFRSPRCGKRFIISWTVSFPGDHCQNCGLPIDS